MELEFWFCCWPELLGQTTSAQRRHLMTFGKIETNFVNCKVPNKEKNRPKRTCFPASSRPCTCHALWPIYSVLFYRSQMMKAKVDRNPFFLVAENIWLWSCLFLKHPFNKESKLQPCWHYSFSRTPVVSPLVGKELAEVRNWSPGFYLFLTVLWYLMLYK